MRKILRLFVLLALLAGLISWRVDAMAATAPSLGAASSFAVLGGTSVTNTGSTVVTGDLGVSPGVTVTGFSPSGTVAGGTIHLNDTTAANAQTAATAAYTNLANQGGTVDKTGTDLGTLTLTPGVYGFSSTAQLTGTLTLDAVGDPNAVWVFQIGSTLTSAASSSVLLINGGQQSNVFWQVGSTATLGASTAFKGTIIALTSITLNTGATVSGRVLARNGTVTLDTNTISVFPSITMLKSVVAYSDPVNVTTNPKAIPGSEMLYTITMTNSGYGSVDNNTTVITDPIPANTALYVGDFNGATSGPVRFTDGATASGLTYTFTALNAPGDDVDFSSNNGTTWAYVPTPGAEDGCDPLVTNLRINPKGTFVGNATPPSPSLSLSFRVCVK